MPNRTEAVVAVVDDDRRVLESLEELLESAGHATRLFSSAQDFLESEALASIHCLISDIRMPGMDGWQLEDIVAAARPSLPIILITGDDLAEQEARSRRAHGRPHALLRKPFDSRELLAAIASAVRRSAE
jgi:FixJ family two-component response regulator